MRRRLCVLALIGSALIAAGCRDDARQAALEPSMALDTTGDTPTGLDERPECLVGVVLASDAATLVAPVTGRVRAIPARVGHAVAAGAVIVELDAESLARRLREEAAVLDAARAVRRRAGVELGRAAAEEARSRSLADLLSRAEQDEAGFAREAAEAALLEAEARVRQVEASIDELSRVLASARVAAPFAGRIASVSTRAGETVAEGSPLVRLVDPSALLVRFAIPVEHVASVSLGDSVRVEVESPPSVDIWSVSAMAPGVDPATQMVFAEAVPTAVGVGAGLLDGTIARVSVATDAETCLASS